MTKAIIFDCFGVLVGEGWKPFCRKYFGETGADRQWADEQMQRVSRAEITHQDFANIIQEKTGVAPDLFLAALHANPPNTELLEYIYELKKTYKIGFLSNVGLNRLSELFTAKQLELFDDITLSYELHISKPHPDIYKHAANKLGVDPGACIFVDDTPLYCKGAESIGMQAIQYSEYETFTQELEKIL